MIRKINSCKIKNQLNIRASIWDHDKSTIIKLKKVTILKLTLSKLGKFIIYVMQHTRTNNFFFFSFNYTLIGALFFFLYKTTKRIKKKERD